MILRDNTAEYAYSIGIHNYDCAYTAIVNNTVRYVNNVGINSRSGSKDTLVQGNYLYAIGAENFGDDLINAGMSTGIAVLVGGDAPKIINNRVDRTGYSSIFLHGSAYSAEVAYNYVTNSCLSLTDGGGLYTGGYRETDKKTNIHHNIFENIYGYVGGWKRFACDISKSPEECADGSRGIYIDERGNNNILSNNTIVNSCSEGIFLHWTTDNVVSNNTIYSARDNSILLSGRNRLHENHENDKFFDNIMFATAPDQNTFALYANFKEIPLIESNHNYFYNPHNEDSVRVLQHGGIDDNISLSEWRDLSGKDLDSKEFRDTFSATNPDNINSRIFTNPTMDVVTIELDKRYNDVDGKVISGTITLQPFESKILLNFEN